jgi:SAM-dependent methyltransferase
MTYAILLYPHANKRYYESVKILGVNELKILTAYFVPEVTNIRFENIGGLELLVFEAAELEEKEKKILYSLSSNFALFELRENNYLNPIMQQRANYFKEDISNILKYKGKTNESFTDLMINIGVFSSDFYGDFDKALSILDPMCGKGTTLFQALIKGYNAAGVEITKNYYTEFENFIKRYFQFHRYKYESSNASFSHEGKKKGNKVIFETADTIENYKKKERRTLQYVNGDTKDTYLFYGKEKFHVIVTDLPYGVQHSSTGASQFVKIDDLLNNSMEGWARTLKKGGTIVLAYNNYTLKKEQLEKILTKYGLSVFSEGVYNEFVHWVEQAVNRDIIVAKK